MHQLSNQERQDSRNQSLYLALKLGDIDIAQMHINRGADVNLMPETSRNVLIDHMIKSGDPDAVKLLIDNGAKLNTSGWSYYNSLSHVTNISDDKARFDIAKLLLEHGVAPIKDDLLTLMESKRDAKTFELALPYFEGYKKDLFWSVLHSYGDDIDNEHHDKAAACKQALKSLLNHGVDMAEVDVSSLQIGRTAKEALAEILQEEKTVSKPVVGDATEKLAAERAVSQGKGRQPGD